MSWLNISTLSPYGVWHLSRVGSFLSQINAAHPTIVIFTFGRNWSERNWSPPFFSASCNAMQDSENRMDANHRWLHGNHSNTNGWNMWPKKWYTRENYTWPIAKTVVSVYISFFLDIFVTSKNKCFLLPTINYTSILFWNNPILSYAQSMSLSQLATSMRKVGCPHQLPAARSFFTSTASTWTGLLAISV